MSIRLVRLKSEEALRAKSLRHNICFPDLPTELQKQEEKQKTFCYSEQWNQHKHLDSFWNNDSLIVIFSSFFLQEQAQTSENKCRTVFNTCKQSHMRVLELFLTIFNFAKNSICDSCPCPFRLSFWRNWTLSKQLQISHASLFTCVKHCPVFFPVVVCLVSKKLRMQKLDFDERNLLFRETMKSAKLNRLLF